MKLMNSIWRSIAALPFAMSLSAAHAQQPAPAQRSEVIQRPVDRLNLSTTVVTGNRELPRVLYIVPWKKAELGELPSQPFNTLLDEVLAPVDRDVFKREVKYFQTIHSGAAESKSAVQASPVKK
jgi:hypothetical protein